MDNKDEYIDQHFSVIDAYNSFILKPAYIDNMAMVTPVEDEFIGTKRMSLTSPIQTNQFLRRTETSLLFIEQIKKDEIFLSIENKSIQQYEIPFLYKAIVKEYYERLMYLRTFFEFPGGSIQWWDNTFSNSLFNDIKLLAQSLDQVKPPLV